MRVPVAFDGGGPWDGRELDLAYDEDAGPPSEVHVAAPRPRPIQWWAPTDEMPLEPTPFMRVYIYRYSRQTDDHMIYTYNPRAKEYRC